MIKASKAAELAGPSADDYLEFIEKKIIEAATNKKREVIIRDNPYCGWLYGSAGNQSEVLKAIKILKDSGYTLDLYYVESQFVDMGLKITW